MGKYKQPDYIKIYMDIITKKYPQKKVTCETLLRKDKLSVLDILKLNEKIFGCEEIQNIKYSQKLRSYNKSDILQMLDYQKKHKLNNTQLANHFKLSRNTVIKWKKIFLI